MLSLILCGNVGTITFHSCSIMYQSYPVVFPHKMMYIRYKNTPTLAYLHANSVYVIKCQCYPESQKDWFHFNMYNILLNELAD